MSLGFIQYNKKQIYKTAAITRTIEEEVRNNNTNIVIKAKSYLRPLILGSVDGIITSFVIIAGGIAGDVSKNSVIVIGFSSLIADAFSMGTSEYLSSRTEHATKKSIIHGFSCFISFVFFGIIPLIVYSVSSVFELGSSILAFIVCLIMMALLKSYILNTFILSSLLEIILLGSVAGGIAYGVAFLSASLQ